MAETKLTVEEIQKKARFINPCFWAVLSFDFTPTEWNQVEEIALEQGWQSASGVGFYMPKGWEPPEKQE